MATVVSVTIYSEISEFPVEKRYDVGIKISELKKKLELITGANHQSMKISVTLDDKLIGDLDDDAKSLAHYIGEEVSKESTVKFVVKDTGPSDLLAGDVPKFTISEDKYSERENNARNFIKELREKRI